MSFLQLEDITKRYEQGGSLALSVPLLEVEKGKRLGIAGETGSGKSTLLKIMGGLEKPDTGKVFFEGEPVFRALDKLIPGHPGIAYLSQHFELPKFLRVHDFLEDEYVMPTNEASQIFEACEVTHLMSKDTRALSGGEKQRIAMAKMLTYAPRLLLLDEPFSNLDQTHKRSMRNALDTIDQLLDTTMIMVSHEPKDLLSWADHLWVLEGGHIVQSGDPKTIYQQPASAYVAGLFGEYNFLSPEKWGSAQALLHQAEGKLIVRPESAVISYARETANGKIEKVHFQGMYDRVQVAMDNDENIISYTQSNGHEVGHRVEVKLQVEGNKKGFR